MSAERIHDRTHGHRGVEFGGEADADRNAGLVLDLLAADAHVVPGVGLHADVAPEIRAIVDGIGNEAVRESEVFLGLRIIGTLDRKIDRLAVLFLARGIDILHVDDLFFVDRRRREKHHQVVALLRRYFRRCARRDQAEVDVVDDYLGAIFGAPFLGVGVVEPLVVGGDEVTPLQDLQCLGRASRRNVEEWSGGRGCTDGGLHHVTA